MRKAPWSYPILIVGLFLAFAAHNSQATVLVNATEGVGKVEITATGTLNLAGLSYLSLGGTSGGVIGPRDGYLILGYTPGLSDLYQGITGPTTFGSGGIKYDTSSSGGTFGLANGLGTLYLPSGFTSGSSISSGSVYAGHTLASLGMETGTYTWSWASDSITLNVISAIPEPDSFAMLLAGLGTLGLAARRRKQKVALSSSLAGTQGEF